jgi:hypothetical protein
MGLVDIFGNDSGAGDRGLAFVDQYRRRGRWIEREKAFPAFPGALFHQPQLETVFAQHQADESRMRTERVMKQREHAALEYVAAS